MKNFLIRTLAGITVVCGATVGLAQQAASAAGTGTVTGHVTCGDTQRPARFASVTLFGVPVEVKAPAKPDPNDVAAMMAAMKSAMGGMNMVQGQTGLDGSFAMTSVAPGDYYVFASVPGYVQPMNMVKAAFEAGVDLTKPIPGVPIVHVVAEHATQAEVSIDRGAAVDGKVVWDDGSPATKAMVMVESPKKDKDKELPQQFAMLAVASVGSGGLVATTDDLGHFRIFGLAPGEYYVKVSMQTHSQFAMQGGSMNLGHLGAESPLVVYAPAAFHKADAKAVTLHAGEDTRDELVTINLGGTHSVSGRIASAVDHHGINSGTVKLEDTQDKDFSRSSGVDAAGNFTVSFVPAGTYTMEVSDAADTEPSKKKATGLMNFNTDHTLKSYQDGKQTVIVMDSDLTGQNVELTPDKKTKEDVDLGGIIGGLVGGTPAPPQ